MTKKKPVNKFKLTPDVNKLLKELAESLPQIPNFIKVGNTYHPQKVAISKVVTGKELMNQGIKEVRGGELKEDEKYVQHGTSIRYINHRVNLIDIYQIHGMPGVEGYKRDVQIIHDQINKPPVIEPNKPVDEIELANNPITENHENKNED